MVKGQSGMSLHMSMQDVEQYAQTLNPYAHSTEASKGH